MKNLWTLMTNPPKNDTWSKLNEFSAVETSMCDDAIYEFLKLFVVVFCGFFFFKFFIFFWFLSEATKNVCNYKIESSVSGYCHQLLKSVLITSNMTWQNKSYFWYKNEGEQICILFSYLVHLTSQQFILYTLKEFYH